MQTKLTFLPPPILALLAAPLFPLVAAAQTADAAAAPEPALRLSDFTVVAETIRDDKVQAPFMPQTQGAVNFTGKKTIVIDFDAMPQIQTDNYRQAFSKTPGLLTSELSNASLLSLNYRGIGDPHESQNMLVLKDGVPFVLDPFGYPTVYYAPPFESVDRLEFVAGGAALLYGPQPSGTLNFVTHTPSRAHAASLTTQHVFGSDNLYSTFSTLEGGIGRVGYLAQFDRRSGDSFRDRNSDFALNGGSVKLVIDAGTDARLILDVDAYDADSGEPGGLTLARGAGLLNYGDSRTQTQNLNDRVRVERTAAVVRYERDFADASLSVSAWASKFSRFSKRQNGSAFGRALTADNNTLALHEYYTTAAEVRYRRDYTRGDDRQTFTLGATALEIESPISNRRGATAAAEEGVRTYKAQRDSSYLALFGEHVFRAGKFTLTPGVRVEFLRQRVNEEQNDARTAAGRALLAADDKTTQPLAGLGATYEFGRGGEFYGNVSTAYKPATYGDLLPTGAGDTVSDRLEPGNVVNYELGWRARPAPGAWIDVSAFAIDYDNRFGRVGSNLQNVGRSLNQGLSVAAEFDLWRQFRGEDRGFTLAWHGNVQWLDAEFVSGPLEGRTPQYAPEVSVRSGLVLRIPNRLKIALLGTYLGDHFADDANTRTASADWLIPAYTVLDLTAEAYVWRGQLAGRDAAAAVLLGVNNLLDEDYWSRVRSNGIDPANDRNYYAGFRFEF